MTVGMKQRNLAPLGRNVMSPLTAPLWMLGMLLAFQPPTMVRAQESNGRTTLCELTLAVIMEDPVLESDGSQRRGLEASGLEDGPAERRFFACAPITFVGEHEADKVAAGLWTLIPQPTEAVLTSIRQSWGGKGWKDLDMADVFALLEDNQLSEIVLNLGTDVYLTDGKAVVRPPEKDDPSEPPPDYTLASSPYDERRNRRRLRAPARTGTIEAIMLRVTTPDASPSFTALELYDYVFTHNLSARSQMSRCSFQQLSIDPLVLSNSVRGVVDVSIDTLAAGAHPNTLTNAAESRVNELYGINIRSTTDLLMFTVPGGTGGWAAYAVVSGKQSVYNDRWGGYLGGLMHEIGHNLGLRHAYEDGRPYEGTTGYMGTAPAQTLTPQRCYNGQNNWHLGWYANRALSIGTGDAARLVKLAAFVDYDLTAADEYVLVRIGDLYLQYNRRKSFNHQTGELGDTLTVVEGHTSKTELLDGIDHQALTSFSTQGVDINIQVCDVVPATSSTADMLLISVGNGATACPAPTPQPSFSPTVSPTPRPTSSPTRRPTPVPTTHPTPVPTPEPSATPTRRPSFEPTPAPNPAHDPTTRRPTTVRPTPVPTVSPTVSPTKYPTVSPTASPTSTPSVSPTAGPTNVPTLTPTHSPTVTPSSATSFPTFAPTILPTLVPTTITESPSARPSIQPTRIIVEQPIFTSQDVNGIALNADTDDGGPPFALFGGAGGAAGAILLCAAIVIMRRKRRVEETKTARIYTEHNDITFEEDFVGESKYKPVAHKHHRRTDSAATLETDVSWSRSDNMNSSLDCSHDSMVEGFSNMFNGACDKQTTGEADPEAGNASAIAHSNSLTLRELATQSTSFLPHVEMSYEMPTCGDFGSLVDETESLPDAWTGPTSPAEASTPNRTISTVPSTPPDPSNLNQTISTIQSHDRSDAPSPAADAPPTPSRSVISMASQDRSESFFQPVYHESQTDDFMLADARMSPIPGSTGRCSPIVEADGENDTVPRPLSMEEGYNVEPSRWYGASPSRSVILKEYDQEQQYEELINRSGHDDLHYIPDSPDRSTFSAYGDDAVTRRQKRRHRIKEDKEKKAKESRLQRLKEQREIQRQELERRREEQQRFVQQQQQQPEVPPSVQRSSRPEISDSGDQQPTITRILPTVTPPKSSPSPNQGDATKGGEEWFPFF